MRKIGDRVFGVLVALVSLLTVLLLAFLIFFIVKESLL